ncbi:hypothetical protein AB1Y20_016866 [Prymnesium parvum]|uniref:JmjC domain-containing protein n=1 Tax=Prymnesium parvum TaxID=97485 RepID=A0AB34ICL8_PRYPA
MCTTEGSGLSLPLVREPQLRAVLRYGSTAVPLRSFAVVDARGAPASLHELSSLGRELYVVGTICAAGELHGRRVRSSPLESWHATAIPPRLLVLSARCCYALPADEAAADPAFAALWRPAAEGGAATRRASARCGRAAAEESPLEARLRPCEALEVQTTRCRTARYARVPRCRACVQNKNEQCRFRFMRRLAVRRGEVVRALGTFADGAGYRLNCGPAGSVVRGEGEEERAREVLRHAAPRLEAIVADEERRTEGEEVVVVNAKARGAPAQKGFLPSGYSKDGGERQVCDWCSTTLSIRYRMCRVCGVELCLSCAEAFRRASSSPPAALTKRCPHSPTHWIVFSKLSRRALASLVHAAAFAAAATPPPPPLPPPSHAHAHATLRRQPSRLAAASSAAFTAAWLSLWERGEPIVVGGVQRRLREQWTPARFSREFGGARVDLVDVRSAAQFAAPLRQFFAGFADASARPRAPDGAEAGGGWRGEPLLKLKDWPPKSDFAEILPRHFDDFMGALPQPHYTRRDGDLNLVSKLPAYMLPPDLGPKMYAAYGSLSEGAQQAVSYGTTCLHMDMADAVNVLVHVQPDGDDAPSEPSLDAAVEEEAAWLRSEGELGGAIWDIWKAEDRPALTAFLWQVADEEGFASKLAHPVHDACFYLDARLRRRLWDERGVRGFHFVQREGDAVFIPAGCPHQVFNIRSSIKMAMDFVSPHHIQECLDLTEDFRRLPRGHGRAHDALGIKDILVHSISHALCVLNPTDGERGTESDEGDAEVVVAAESDESYSETYVTAEVVVNPPRRKRRAARGQQSERLKARAAGSCSSGAMEIGTESHSSWSHRSPSCS